MWDGFIGPLNLAVHRDTQNVDAFKLAVRQRFQSNNVHVDIFDRHRPTFEGKDCALVQVTVYREGLPDDFLNSRMKILSVGRANPCLRPL